MSARAVALVASAVAVSTACALTGFASSAVAAPGRAVPTLSQASAGTADAPHSLQRGQTLRGALRSPNGRFVAQVTGRGRLVVSRAGHTVWHSTGAHGSHAVLQLRPSGNLTLQSGHRLLWSTDTKGSDAGRLRLTDSGRLQLGSPGGRVWTSGVGNLCRAKATAGKRVDVDLSTQSAKLCRGDQQLLTTPITSGATDLGDGTPTGTWRVQAKVRNTHLYPAAGGVYFVRYWMPYDGAYGMHDSSWQKFPYGSDKYRKHGSHGCVHFPRAAIAWMFRWASIGTLVHIHD